MYLLFINLYICSICLYIGHESYHYLHQVNKKFIHELNILKTHGFKDKSDFVWPVELYFSGDWKFLALVLGINAPTSNYFCLYCDCYKDERYDMDKVWNNAKNTKGKFNNLFFLFII